MPCDEGIFGSLELFGQVWLFFGWRLFLGAVLAGFFYLTVFEESNSLAD